jgi:hypothetical protein
MYTTVLTISAILFSIIYVIMLIKEHRRSFAKNKSHILDQRLKRNRLNAIHYAFTYDTIRAQERSKTEDYLYELFIKEWEKQVKWCIKHRKPIPDHFIVYTDVVRDLELIPEDVKEFHIQEKNINYHFNTNNFPYTEIIVQNSIYVETLDKIEKAKNAERTRTCNA